MNYRYCRFACVVLACSFPSIAFASDFGGLAVGGLLILAAMCGSSLVLAAVTSSVLKRYAQTNVGWWWLLFVPAWFYVVFQAYRFLS